MLLVGSLLLLTSGAAIAQPFWSVGPKIGAVLGENGGFTWGFEGTYFPQGILPLWGFNADLTFWKQHSTLHVGIEGNYVIGLDVGPTLFFHDGSIQLGMSAIPFVALLLVGYYEVAWPFFQTPFQSVGGYLKIPVGIAWSPPQGTVG